MNETTLFLVQIMGPIFFFVGLGILMNTHNLAKIFKDLKKEPFALYMATMAMIAVGMAIVLKHFLWGSVPEVLVSIVGLGILAKGLMLALIPRAFEKLVNAILSSTLVRFGGAVWVIGGAYLCYLGFLV